MGMIRKKQLIEIQQNEKELVQFFSHEMEKERKKGELRLKT